MSPPTGPACAATRSPCGRGLGAAQRTKHVSAIRRSRPVAGGHGRLIDEGQRDAADDDHAGRRRMRAQVRSIGSSESGELSDIGRHTRHAHAAHQHALL